MINKPKNNHKIRTMWDDVKKLISMEEELFRRLDVLESSVNRLWKKVADTNKQC